MYIGYIMEMMMMMMMMMVKNRELERSHLNMA